MNSIVSAASGRSVSSSTTSARGSSRGGGSAAGSAGRPPRALAEGDHAPPGRGVLVERAAASRGGKRQRAGAVEHVGRAEHVARAGPPPFSVSPLHFHSEENGTSAATALGARREALGDRLAGSGCARRRRRRSAPAPARPPPASSGSAGSTRDQLELAVGQRAGLVDADRVDRGQRLGRADLLDERVHRAPGARAATARVTLISRTRPSGISVISPAVAVCAASVKSVSRRLSATSSDDRERHQHDRRRPEDPVDLLLERRGRVAELARLAGDLLGVGVLADRVDLVVARARDRERAREQPVAARACGSRRTRRSAATRRSSARATRSPRRRRRAGRRARPGSRRRARPRRRAARSIAPSRIDLRARARPAARARRASPSPSAPGGCRCSC